MGKSGMGQQAEEENADLRQKSCKSVGRGSSSRAKDNQTLETPLPGLRICLTAPDGDTIGVEDQGQGVGAMCL